MCCGRIDLAALGRRFRPLATLAGVLERANLVDVVAHKNVPFSVVVIPTY
jgi:hypothetical protein